MDKQTKPQWKCSKHFEDIYLTINKKLETWKKHKETKMFFVVTSFFYWKKQIYLRSKNWFVFNLSFYDDGQSWNFWNEKIKLYYIYKQSLTYIRIPASFCSSWNILIIFAFCSLFYPDTYLHGNLKVKS